MTIVIRTLNFYGNLQKPISGDSQCHICCIGKKLLLLRQNNLERDLKIESAHKSRPTKANLIKTQTIRAALNSILDEKASRSLFYQRQRLYEYGNKPSKYLARLLNQKQSNNTIAGIRDPGGKRYFDKKTINSVFVSFYKSLYTIYIQFFLQN